VGQFELGDNDLNDQVDILSSAKDKLKILKLLFRRRRSIKSGSSFVGINFIVNDLFLTAFGMTYRIMELSCIKDIKKTARSGAVFINRQIRSLSGLPVSYLF
jgi:hypothetical protein